MVRAEKREESQQVVSDDNEVSEKIVVSGVLPTHFFTPAVFVVSFDMFG